MVNDKIFRHNPTQKRSRSRVASILQAAEMVFQEVGYEAATTNAIADRANIPIGSLYQYFRNKKAILDALSKQYGEELRELYNVTFQQPVTRDNIYELADALLDDLTDFYRSHPAFQVVFYGSCRADDLGAASDELHQMIINYVYQSLFRTAAKQDETHLMIVATILVKSARAVMPEVVNREGKIDRTVLRELKNLVKSYLRTTLDAS